MKRSKLTVSELAKAIFKQKRIPIPETVNESELQALVDCLERDHVTIFYGYGEPESAERAWYVRPQSIAANDVLIHGTSSGIT